MQEDIVSEINLLQVECELTYNKFIVYAQIII